MATSFIAYYRVSTKKQALGLDAQRDICQRFAEANGGCIVAEFSEKETGKDTGTLYTNRQQLVAALAAVKKQGAVLLVAKMDRLTRDLETGAHLCKNYDIRFCDHPSLRTATEQGIFFGMAMDERTFISTRTKQALAAKKEQRKALGLGANDLDERGKRATGKPNCTWTAEQQANAHKARKMAAVNDPNNSRAWALCIAYAGLPAAQIALRLNAAGFVTSRGSQWTSGAVIRLTNLMTSYAEARLGDPSMPVIGWPAGMTWKSYSADRKAMDAKQGAE